MDGGVGDHVASLVALNYINSRYRWITPLVWTPDYLVDFAKRLLPKVSIRGYSEMKAHYNPHMTTRTTKWDNIISPMKIPLLDYAFLKLADENPDIIHKNYLQIPQPEDYKGNQVVITTGYTAKAREFPAKHINGVIDYILAKGYKPVFLGKKETATGAKHTIQGNFDAEVRYEKGLDLRDKTTLWEAAEIMAKSVAVVGVDNGLLHIAGCTDVPIVGGFPSVRPEIRMPVRYGHLGWEFYPVVPPESVKCRFAQQDTNFIYGHDYRECICNDYACTGSMSAEAFIEQLEKIL